MATVLCFCGIASEDICRMDRTTRRLVFPEAKTPFRLHTHHNKQALVATICACSLLVELLCCLGDTVTSLTYPLTPLASSFPTHSLSHSHILSTSIQTGSFNWLSQAYRLYPRPDDSWLYWAVSVWRLLAAVGIPIVCLFINPDIATRPTSAVARFANSIKNRLDELFHQQISENERDDRTDEADRRLHATFVYLSLAGHSACVLALALAAYSAQSLWFVSVFVLLRALNTCATSGLTQEDLIKEHIKDLEILNELTMWPARPRTYEDRKSSLRRFALARRPSYDIGQNSDSGMLEIELIKASLFKDVLNFLGRPRYTYVVMTYGGGSVPVVSTSEMRRGHSPYWTTDEKQKFRVQLEPKEYTILFEIKDSGRQCSGVV